MSNSALDKIFKQELDDAGYNYQEALWQRLDSQLQPVRNQRQPERRRRVAVLILLLLVAGGGVAWLASRQVGGRTDAATDTAANTAKAPGTSGSRSATAPVSNPPVQNNPGAAQVPETVIREAGIPPEDVVATQPSVNSSIQPLDNTPVAVSPAVTGRSNNPVITTRAARTRTRTPVQAPVILGDKDVKEIEADAATKKLTPEDTKMPVPNVTDLGTDKTPVTVAQAAEITATHSQPDETAASTKPLPETKPSKAATAKAVKQKTESSRLAYHINAGANWSSPFNKPGVFGGVMATKTIGDKHLFAGIKLAGNSLHHEFTSASKVNQTPVVTDAVIEKITTLQLPFGYEFGLNGSRKKAANTFLQLGFEPSFVTSVRTIFYDDNGIPGGPVTPVMNSPLLSRAINKFNVSFVAGIRKQIGGNLGLSLTGGYNLIDITDKQYYNRTTRNNNMRYLQAGLQWRIHR